MSESGDFGGFEQIDAGADDTSTEPGTEVDVFVYDAEPIDDPEGDGDSEGDDIIDGEAVEPGLEIYEGWPAEQEPTITVTASDLPPLDAEIDDTPAAGHRVTSDSAPASAGVGGGLGGGKLTKRCPRCGYNPCRCRKGRRGNSGGGDGGSGPKFHFSILGGLNFLSGNRAEANAVKNTAPIASPTVTGISTGTGRRPHATGPRRPLRD